MGQTKYDYDFFVIGGGSGGVRAARIAATHGAKVGLAENANLGGTCVNLGCVPKKLFVYASEFSHHFEDAKGYGWSVGKSSFDWKTLIKNKDKEIKRLNGIYQNMLQNAGVDIIRGFARFKDAHTVEIDGKTYTAKNILIATGGLPRKPDFQGSKHCVVSDDVFHLDKLPKRISIYGGGYIALEFASIFKGLGLDVDIIYRGDLFLRHFDIDVRKHLRDEMQKQGINLVFKNTIQKVEKSGTSYKVTLDDGQTIETGLIMSAIGRNPKTDGLNLDKAGVKTNTKGGMDVNDDYQTNEKHIYAVGDITGGYELTPVALAEGHVLADRLFNKQKDRAVGYENIATAVFTSPPIGTVGPTEEQARKKYKTIDVYSSTFKPMKHTMTGRDEKTMMKLVVDRDTDRVVGCHMVGPDAGEIIQGLAIAMNVGAKKADFDRTIGIHPTAAEEFVTMRIPRKN